MNPIITCRVKEDRQKKSVSTTPCFHLHKTMESANQSTGTERRVVLWRMGWKTEGQGRGIPRGYRHAKSFEGGEYVHCFDRGENFTSACRGINLPNGMLQICTVYCMSILPQ